MEKLSCVGTAGIRISWLDAAGARLFIPRINTNQTGKLCDTDKNMMSVELRLGGCMVFKFSITAPDAGAPSSGRDYAAIASAIIEGLGGPANITSVDSCITRLRTEVKNCAAVDEEKIKSADIPAVIRLSRTSVQVVVGTQIPFVADEVKRQLEEMGQDLYALPARSNQVGVGVCPSQLLCKGAFTARKVCRLQTKQKFYPSRPPVADRTRCNKTRALNAQSRAGSWKNEAFVLQWQGTTEPLMPADTAGHRRHMDHGGREGQPDFLSPRLWRYMSGCFQVFPEEPDQILSQLQPRPKRRIQSSSPAPPSADGQSPLEPSGWQMNTEYQGGTRDHESDSRKRL